MREVPIEKKELWGITPPSLLACSGAAIAIAGSWLSSRQAWGVGVGIIGLCLIGLAIRMNWTKGLNVRWRKANFILHIVLFILSLAALVLSWTGQTIFRK